MPSSPGPKRHQKKNTPCSRGRERIALTTIPVSVPTRLAQPNKSREPTARSGARNPGPRCCGEGRLVIELTRVTVASYTILLLRCGECLRFELIAQIYVSDGIPQSPYDRQPHRLRLYGLNSIACPCFFFS